MPPGFRANIQRMCLGLLSLEFRVVTRQTGQTKRMLTKAVAFPWESMSYTPRYRSSNTDHGCRLQMGDHSINRWVPSIKARILYTQHSETPEMFIILFQMLMFLGNILGQSPLLTLTTCWYWGEMGRLECHQMS